ncbi:hypothetical protein HOC80_03935 [archaeon]|jgi:hypothetical protein|nr:hypothetical protein [archaeon]MBT4417224.1 hypothetical protein [archaeon]
MSDIDFDLGEVVQNAFGKAFAQIAVDIEREGEAYFDKAVEDLDPNSVGATLGYPFLLGIVQRAGERYGPKEEEGL